MREYQLSTPIYTCWVQCTAHGIIHDCAPYLYRRWRGKPWRQLLGAARWRWGSKVRVTELWEKAP